MSGDRFLVLVMPSAADAPIAWRRLAEGDEIASGDDLVAIEPAEDDQLIEAVVAIVPAADVTVNWAEMPDLAPAQARAAARLLASENSMSPLEALHVAIGADEVDREDRLIATVDRARMSDWLGRAQALSFDPDIMLPASLLVPRPEEGFVRAEIFGQTVLRSHNSAFLDEDGLSALITGDAPVAALENGAAEAALFPILMAPPVNLRQGAFAKKKRWQIDWPLVRRLLWLGLGIVAVTLLINLLLILKYNAAADAMELRTRALAQSAVPGVSGDANAVAALEERLAASRGGGAGFATTSSAIFAAVRAVPNIEVTAFDFGVDGSLRLTIAAATPEDIAAFQRQLERYGFDGTASAPQQAAGRQIVEMTVRLP